MDKIVVVFALSILLASTALAQFTGPSVAGRVVSVAQAKDSLPGRYVTVSGHIAAHLRGDYYSFRDGTGEIRVEIEDKAWLGRQIGPETKVRLLAEVDLGPTGRYLWVKSIDLVD